MRSTDLPLDEMRAGLELLLKAYDFAGDAGCESSEFAVEIERLQQAGLLVEHLRWLIAKGYARHVVEVSEDGNDKRAFLPAKSKFHKHSCFFLVDRGAEFARGLCRKRRKPAAIAKQSRQKRAAPARTASSGKPHWNVVKRILEFGGEILGSFSRPAPNQQGALDEFEALGWKNAIDCRSFLKGKNIKNQIHNTINALNKKLRLKRICFATDGTGYGIKWCTLPCDPTPTLPAASLSAGNGRRNGRSKS
jgi:hypothetical protein